MIYVVGISYVYGPSDCLGLRFLHIYGQFDVCARYVDDKIRGSQKQAKEIK